MCLIKVTRQYKNPVGKNWKRGWKVFIGTDPHKPNFLFRSLKDVIRVPLDQLLQADSSTLVETYPAGKTYPSGFHYYTNRPKLPAVNWSFDRIVCPVWVKETTTIGLEEFTSMKGAIQVKCGVAQQMKVSSKDWKEALELAKSAQKGPQ